MPTHQACMKEKGAEFDWGREKIQTIQTRQFGSWKCVLLARKRSRNQPACLTPEPHIINPTAPSWIVRAGIDMAIDRTDIPSSAVCRQHQLSSLSFSWHFHCKCPVNNEGLTIGPLTQDTKKDRSCKCSHLKVSWAVFVSVSHPLLFGLLEEERLICNRRLFFPCDRQVTYIVKSLMSSWFKYI